MPDRKLIIIGYGDHMKVLQNISNKNIVFVGPRYGDELVQLVQQSIGLVFPGEEDFGIVPIEVMAAGKPVFALHKGGLTETILQGKTGEFFYDKMGKDFIEQFKMFHKNNIDGIYEAEVCQRQAEYFSSEIFEKNLRDILASRGVNI